MVTMKVLILLCTLIGTAIAAYCRGKPSPDAKVNTNPIHITDPTELHVVPNGRAYKGGQGEFSFHILHLYGSAYEMGYAHGSLFPEEVRDVTSSVWEYMVKHVAKNLDSLPAWLAEMIVDIGLELALDVLMELTKEYTGAYFYEELQGLADASGVDFKRLYRIHLIGELTQGDCSMIGAWGSATLNGKTIQLRSLDWDTDGPFKRFPAVIIYHPTTPGSHEFANVGFISWIGALTGQSSQKLGISEIGVSYPDEEHFIGESYEGIPFIFLLRDILQFDKTYLDAVKRIQDAKRTCQLILGVGDGKAEHATFRGFAYSHEALFVYDDKNMQPYNATGHTWHPRFNDIVYWGMDWLCPGFSAPMSYLLSKGYGKITPELIIRNITSLIQTGDLHLAVYDLTDNLMYVSFMAKVVNATTRNPYAYDRPFTRLNLTHLFNIPAPSPSELINHESVVI